MDSDNYRTKQFFGTSNMNSKHNGLTHVTGCRTKFLKLQDLLSICRKKTGSTVWPDSFQVDYKMDKRGTCTIYKGLSPSHNEIALERLFIP